MNAGTTVTAPAPWRFGVLFALLGLVAALTPRGLSFMPLLAWIWLALPLPRLPRTWRPGLAVPQPGNPLLPLGLLISYAFLSAAWSSQPAEVLEKALLVLLILASAWFLIEYSGNLDPDAFQPGGSISRLLLVCCASGYSLLLLESVLDGWLYRHFWLEMFPSPGSGERFGAESPGEHHNAMLNLGFMSGALLVFPVAMLLRSRLVSTLLLAAMLASVVLFSSNQSAMAGLILGTGIVLLLPLAPAWMQRGAVWLMLLGFTLLPFCIALMRTPGIVHLLDEAFTSVYLAPRFSVYAAALSDILARPWLGYGFHASRIDAAFAYAHPHNYALQAWLELGIMGLLLIVWLLACILRTIETLDRRWRYWALGAFFSALCGAAFSYNAWRSWWIGMLCVLIWLFVVFARDAATGTTRPALHKSGE